MSHHYPQQLRQKMIRETEQYLESQIPGSGPRMDCPAFDAPGALADAFEPQDVGPSLYTRATQALQWAGACVVTVVQLLR